MSLNLQPILKNDRVSLRPVHAADFEALYAIAQDPLIWQQHPTPTRYQREVFANYFDGALQSKGALLIYKSVDQSLIGCTRFYDLDLADRSVKIGYTFLKRDCWGGGYNLACKSLLLDDAFVHVERVLFEVGLCNVRSQIAMTRLGATTIGQSELAYHGERAAPNVIFEIRKAGWNAAQGAA